MTATTAEHPALAAVALLIRRDTMRPTGSQITLHAPCLLAQLAEAVGVGIETGGGRAVPSSRPPVAVDALDLWVEIVYNTHGWAESFGIPRRDTNPEADTPHVGRLLRSVAATAESRGRTDLAERIAVKARRWHGQITAMLCGQIQQRPIRGASCPECGSKWIHNQRDDGLYREPAVAIVTEEDLPWLVCRACGWNKHATDPNTTELAYATGDDDPEEET